MPRELCSLFLSPVTTVGVVQLHLAQERRAKKDFQNHSSITNQFLSFQNTFSSFGVTGTASPNFENKGQQIPNWPHPSGKQELITHRIFLWHKQLMLWNQPEL